MKKVLIITLYSNNNFGNKLQNYALQEYIKRLDSDIEVKTQKIKYEKNTDNIIKFYIWKIYNFIRRRKKKPDNREKKFIEFSNIYMNYTEQFVSTNARRKIRGYDYYIYGSDQIWNPHGPGESNCFLGLLTDNNISYAASLSADDVPEKLIKKYNKSLSRFKRISIREEKGKEIVQSITKRNDIEVLIDPTMLLTAKDWEIIEKKPKKLKSKKYILNYFLGDLSIERKKEIDRIAQENNCDVINILDKDDPLYESGPSEFLYLERNAFLICTDSFHSSVFAILYNRPFVIFKREQENLNNMFSRIDTLITKLKIEDRVYNGEKITSKNLRHDYTAAYGILDKERKKSDIFLRQTLNIKDSE